MNDLPNDTTARLPLLRKPLAVPLMVPTCRVAPLSPIEPPLTDYAFGIDDLCPEVRATDDVLVAELEAEADEGLRRMLDRQLDETQWVSREPPAPKLRELLEEAARTIEPVYEPQPHGLSTVASSPFSHAPPAITVAPLSVDGLAKVGSPNSL
jgi:hypothetical protein